LVNPRVIAGADKLSNMKFNNNLPLEGVFNQTPFPALCLEIWRAQLTGELSFPKNINHPSLFFKEGDLLLSIDQLEPEEFSRFIATKENIINPPEIAAGGETQSKSSPLIKNLIEKFSLSPQKVWQHLQDYFFLSLQPLFDSPEGSYCFLPSSTPASENILLRLPTPEVIQAGILAMKNLDLLSRYYPDKMAIIRIKKSPAGLPRLTEPAKYLLSLLAKPVTINHLLQISQLGEKETYRLLFLLSCFKIINLALSKSINQPALASPQQLAQIIGEFNEKSSIILKYLSKEIGPVAINIIRKSISECKAMLPPLFSDLEIAENGQITFGRVFKAGIAYASPELQEKVIEGLNELLLNQIIAVKRTLGDDHEMRLVDTLQSCPK